MGPQKPSRGRPGKVFGSQTPSTPPKKGAGHGENARLSFRAPPPAGPPALCPGPWLWRSRCFSPWAGLRARTRSAHAERSCCFRCVRPACPPTAGMEGGRGQALTRQKPGGKQAPARGPGPWAAAAPRQGSPTRPGRPSAALGRTQCVSLSAGSPLRLCAQRRQRDLPWEQPAGSHSRECHSAEQRQVLSFQGQESIYLRHQNARRGRKESQRPGESSSLS